MRWENKEERLSAHPLDSIKYGITGGGTSIIWTQDSEIWNNCFLDTRTAKHEHYYGIK